MGMANVEPPKDGKLTKLEIEQARQQLLALRAQIKVLNTEVCITDPTHKMLDHVLHNLIDFANKVYAQKTMTDKEGLSYGSNTQHRQ